MKVFLDDERQTPEGWVRTYTVEETIELLKSGEVTDLSLDNDLGEGVEEGYKVLDWLEEEVVMKSFKPPENISAHSQNAVRRVYMRDLIKRIYQLYDRLHG